jgi:hypothetical protein
MTNDMPYGIHASREARIVFTCLARRGGSMRLKPLLRRLGMEPRIFVEAVTELAERYWIIIHCRKPAPGTPDDEPRPYTDIERLCATRFGRRKYRTTWPVD